MHFGFVSPNFNSSHLSLLISKQGNMAKGTKYWNKIKKRKTKMNRKKIKILSLEVFPYKSLQTCEITI